ncbi:hypothetical protein FHL05_10820 [Lactobacillus halodurans]|uniref:Toprim domain-containing protein n=1 Tax=Companilactobacillus halodurans TaxID=2584183 RepID=A0A5P0ZZ35_9LACO|nr:hypothetical protein [Companilactobacillus halodurans]
MQVFCRGTRGSFKDLLTKADTIIVATDSGREGSNIAWSIMSQAQIDVKKKTIKRLWLNSLEKDAIITGFKNLGDWHQDYFELNAEILANQQKFVAKLDPYQQFKDETGLITFMQAKHVHKGSQAGLIKDVQKQGKNVLVPNYSRYLVCKVP